MAPRIPSRPGILAVISVTAAFALLTGLSAGLLPEAASARRPVTKMKLQGEIKNELNAVLKATVELQEASFRRNDKDIAKSLKRLLGRIESANRKTPLAKEQRTHLQKLLGAAQTALEKGRRTTGADRQTFMQKAFKQMVTIAQAYQLEPYKMFFCPKDKSVWLQRSSKPQNPINPETHGNCGKPVT
jgi:hypothetical protein